MMCEENILRTGKKIREPAVNWEPLSYATVNEIVLKHQITDARLL